MKISLDFPWLDYSAIRTYYTCQRKFKFMVLDKKQNDQSFEWILRGNEFHLLFNSFFDQVDLDKVVELCKDLKVMEPPEQSELFKYFTQVLWKTLDTDYVVKIDEGGEHLYELNIYGFACFQVMIIVELMMTKGYVNKKMLIDHWVPKEREVFIKDDEHMLYGTLDSWWDNPDKTMTVLDYKTGKKPKRKFDEKLAQYVPPHMHFPSNVQGWMYLWLLSIRYNRPLKGCKFILLYTKGNPTPVILKITKSGIDGLFRRVNLIRDHVKSGRLFEMPKPENQDFICPWCQYQSQCHDDERLMKYAKIRKEEWAE